MVRAPIVVRLMLVIAVLGLTYSPATTADDQEKFPPDRIEQLVAPIAFYPAAEGVAAYAQHVRSTPGWHDGLYWDTSDGQDESPIGPLLASAARKGYRRDPNAMGPRTAEIASATTEYDPDDSWTPVDSPDLVD